VVVLVCALKGVKNRFVFLQRDSLAQEPGEFCLLYSAEGQHLVAERVGEEEHWREDCHHHREEHCRKGVKKVPAMEEGSSPLK